MAGFLPGTRPLSANYGPDVVDDRPVEDPERELSADTHNKVKADVAYVARTAALLRVRVTESGGAYSVGSVAGPEGVLPGDVTVTKNGDGDVSVDISATGVTCTEARVQPLWDGSVYVTAMVEIVSPTQIRVRMQDTFGISAHNNDFTLWIE